MDSNSTPIVWSGKWHSLFDEERINGSMVISLAPFVQLHLRSPYKTEISISYEGLYRKGEEVKLPISVLLTKNVNEDLDISYENRLSTATDPLYTMKIIVVGIQVITYNIHSISNIEIKGEYESISPFDKGKFVLHPSPEYVTSYLSQTSCIIC